MTTVQSQIPRPIRSGDVPWIEWTAGTRFGERYRHLSRALLGEDYRIGVAVEELAPGRQSSPTHYHALEEEHVFLLEGEVTARIGSRSYAMKAGDYACFPAGRQAAHCLLNEGDRPCRYLIIGENRPNDVAVYTDSRKLLVRALGPRALFDLEATRDYWEREETGPGALPPWTAAAELEPQAPIPPLASDELAWDEEGRGPRFGGHSRHLTHAAVGAAYHVGVLIEAPLPGMRLAPRHYHLLEEEHAFVLEGEVTLLLGDESHVMKPGDYVAFPAGQKVGHAFLNSGAEPCRYLMIGQRDANDVCVYPDSNKVAVGALGERGHILDLGAVRAYFDGEETG